jgi:hypothetical protein
VSAFDPDLAPVRCESCGQEVVLLPARPGELPCPICRARDARDEAAIPPGPWPVLAIVRGEPLAGALWVALPPGGHALDAGEGPVAWLESTAQGRVSGVALTAARLDGASLSPGVPFELARGSRLAIAGRELVRT